MFTHAVLVERSIFLDIAEKIPKLKSRIQKQHQQQQQAAQQAKQGGGGGKGKGGKGKKRWIFYSPPTVSNNSW